MRRAIYVVAAVFVFIICAPRAKAQEQPGCGYLTPCEQDFPEDPDTMGDTGTRCTDSYGCPQCALTNDLSASTCYRVYGNWGWCSCTANGVYYDQYGIKRPRCTLKGSCTVR